MDNVDSTSQYLLPVGMTVLAIVGLLALLAMLARWGVAVGVWGWLVKHWIVAGFFIAALVLIVTLETYFRLDTEAERFRTYILRDAPNLAPLIPDTPGLKKQVSSQMIAVRPGATYRFGVCLKTARETMPYEAQARLLWYDRSLTVLSWDDAPVWKVTRPSGDYWSSGAYHDCSRYEPKAYFAGAYVAPVGAARLKFELHFVGEGNGLLTPEMTLTQDGIYIAPHPNGASAALAFSFDWESAMGGAIHSRGMDVHDPKGATEHGMAMREGADWLNDLFKRYSIKATFYGTGYNLLDGNTERRTFSGDLKYRWAGRKNGWATDYWLTHPWYGDDPYGTTQTDPAWYFGDQTRVLLAAGHEIAPHTFGHLYVRGSNPTELAADSDEWLSAAKSLGITDTATFAFPWRSSNSLTPDFYDVLWKRGIRAVTRVYPLDMKDQYTLGAAAAYPDIAVMPDFLLGAESATGGEGAGNPITGDEGLQVIRNAITRRGTTSFWQHPEQLAPAPALAGIRADWEKVVSKAAKERDNGRLWVDTVANITAYQRDIMSVTVSLDKEFFGGWKIRVHSDLDRPISGVTLTLPGDAARVSSADVDVRTVHTVESSSDGKNVSVVTNVSESDKPVYPTRQLVLNNLMGNATIDVEWAQGQEPLR